jgi:[ribosomal protein S18]-alanine N-acetyltransferase
MQIFSHQDDELRHLRTLCEHWDYWSFADIIACLQRPGHELIYTADWSALVFYFVSKNEFADLFYIYVAPQSRGQGLGSRVLQNWTENLKERYSITRVVLEVRSDNLAAIAMYKMVGFTQSGTKKNYYAKDQCDALSFIKQLS